MLQVVDFSGFVSPQSLLRARACEAMIRVSRANFEHVSRRAERRAIASVGSTKRQLPKVSSDFRTPGNAFPVDHFYVVVFVHVFSWPFYSSSYARGTPGTNTWRRVRTKGTGSR